MIRMMDIWRVFSKTSLLQYLLIQVYTYVLMYLEIQIASDQTLKLSFDIETA